MYGDQSGKPQASSNQNASTSNLKERKSRASGGDSMSIRSASTSAPRTKKTPEIPQIERRNWLIHLHFLRHEYDKCKQLIDLQLNETQGMCEYALYIQGLIKRQDGKLTDSLEMFQTCMMLNANNLENVKQVARSLYLLGRHSSAIEVYEEAALLKPKDWEIWHNLGECYHSIGDFEKAKDRFRQALQLSKREETFLMLGRACVQQKDIASATDVYRRALDYFADSSQVHTALGLLFLSTGNHAKAFEHVGTALTFDMTNREALLAAGTIMQRNNDFDVALSKYRHAAALSPDSAPLWNNIGMCFFGRKKYVTAISCLKRALYLVPLEWKILYNLGLVHLTMQQYASAFHFLSAAINIKPMFGEMFMLLAVALTHLDDPDNARLAYEQANELNKTDPIVCLNFAIFLYNRKEFSVSSQQLSAYEFRMARFGQTAHGNVDQEHLEVANQLGVALAAVEGQHRPTGSKA